MTRIGVPDLCLVVLIGPSSAGKSTFAARHFADSEVVSSDFCRFLVADDPNDQSATGDAFDVLHYIAGKRLAAGRLTVVDATNVQREARKPLIELARAHHVLPVAIVLDVPEQVSAARNQERPDRRLPDRVLRRQRDQMRRSLRGLQREGFRRVFTLKGLDEIEAVTIERERRWTDHTDDHGPFDIVGDVHGCADELVELLGDLGYQVAGDRSTAAHPDGRQAVFVGDLVDRGPDSPGVLRLVMGMVADGAARCVPGNHENKLVRALRGRQVTLSHGLAETMEQLAACDQAFRDQVVEFLDGLISHVVLDDGNLVVAHAGLPAEMHNRASSQVRSFALYGETTGETDEFGLPVRYPWAADYRGDAAVVYGHTPVPTAEWLNNTICLDTGCVFGGHLTALRYPERELVSVPAKRTYYEPIKPLAPPVEERPTNLLDVSDVSGKRIIDTPLQRNITIREENATAALEVMSRFAVDPRWLIYLPPTMAPTDTSDRPDLLEHPDEAFAAYRKAGVTNVICQEKHMGSRAVAIVCRSAGVAADRFGIESPNGGIIHTRTGRRFLDYPAWESALLDRLRAAIGAAGLWDELETDWIALDAELLPWSAKAEPLLRTQYAAVGASAQRSLAAAADHLKAAVERGVAVADLAERVTSRATDASAFVDAYRRYVWPVDSVDDLRLAPFVVLAGEGSVTAVRDHRWHMSIADRLAAAAPDLISPTANIEVDCDDADSCAAAVAWWEETTGRGGEGMVVKPIEGITKGVQPGIKCRGPEYLRLIYGPHYPSSLDQLRQRNVGRKRSLAMRELALGIESLERFVRREPLHRVHECVFGVLALESEPIDPRL